MIVTEVDVVDATEETLGVVLGEAFSGGGGLLNVPGASSETITTGGAGDSSGEGVLAVSPRSKTKGRSSTSSSSSSISIASFSMSTTTRVVSDLSLGGQLIRGPGTKVVVAFFWS